MQKTSTLKLALPTANDDVIETVQAIADSNERIDRAISWVGMVVQSTIEVDVESIYGGTWTRVEGVFLVGAGDEFGAGSTGGAKDHKHLTSLGFDDNCMYGYYNPTGDTPGYGSITQKANTKRWEISNSSSEAVQRLAYTDKASTLPPYMAVYMYTRVA